MRHCFLWLLLWMGGVGLRPAVAQTPGSAFGFQFGSVAQIVQGADTLSQAWVGGLNTPQFSSIDLDGDGQLDLFAFDRQSARCYTFLNVVGVGGTGRRWQYAPDYEWAFPSDLTSWALLRDYDCDGRPDLFTGAQGGDIRVFRNVADAQGHPSFVLANNQLSFPGGNGYVSNLNSGFYNLPGIQDVNGDGRLDILTYDFINSVVLELYLNTSPDACGGISSFAKTNGRWGQLQACVDCASYQLPGAPACQPYRVQHSTGHNVLLLDLDGDGKLDLLDGRDNCALLTRLLNQGPSSVDALFAPAGTSSAFPPAAPVSLALFPAAYSFDADFDGVPDLVVSGNTRNVILDRVSQRNNVWQYHNAAASAAAVPNFSLVSKSFLQSDMLDASEGAVPVFGDVDGDGLTDLLVGNQGDLVNGYYRASIYYYRNVGSAARPVFRLETEDYLGLAARAALTPAVGFESLRPALADLNHDGAPDLVYSVYDGTTNHLNYLLNAAPAGQGLRFDAARASYFKPPGAAGSGGLPARSGDTPCFVDVDGDGYPDMLLGTNDVNEAGGSLRYFRNRGAAAAGDVDHLFVLADNDYGHLLSTGRRPPYLSPAVADFDGDGRLDLLTLDGTGAVTLYPGFQQQASPFVGRTELFYNAFARQYEPARLGGYGTVELRFAAAAADLNRDGRPELYVGAMTGGVVSFLGRNGAAVLAARPPAAAVAALAFSLYPNPARQAATAETAQPTRLTLFDLAGRQVLADATLARQHQLDLRSLAPGVYLVRATAADGTSTSQRLAVAGQ